MNEDIIVETKDRVATVTFNRPEKRNAINYDGWRTIGRICEQLARDSDVRVVVLTGQGTEAFSAGADISDFEKLRSNSEQAKVYASAFDGAVDAVEAMPQPTICKIKGFCMGGGCELSLGTDMRIAADNGRFGIPTARLGILIGYREMRRLVSLVGPGSASYILMSARQLDAIHAQRIGLVNEVVPLDQIDEYVDELAAEMAELAPLSQSRHKTIMRAVLENPGLEGLTLDDEELPFKNFDSEDFHEGRRAFLQRRPPRFKGE